MKLTNTPTSYGLLAIIIHWLMAVLVIGMFILGNYMVGLDYYDTWYHQAPWWHKSFGLLLFLILCIRIAVKITNIPLTPLASYKKWEIVIAKITHYLFYLLLFVSCMSGYFVSTAKSVGVEVFNWFEFPAMMTLTESQTDIFGEIHEVSTYCLLVLFLLHLTAVVKHHFIDRDSTLKRMLGVNK